MPSNDPLVFEEQSGLSAPKIPPQKPNAHSPELIVKHELYISSPGIPSIIAFVIASPLKMHYSLSEKGAESNNNISRLCKYSPLEKE